LLKTFCTSSQSSIASSSLKSFSAVSASPIASVYWGTNWTSADS